MRKEKEEFALAWFEARANAERTQKENSTLLYFAFLIRLEGKKEGVITMRPN